MQLKASDLDDSEWALIQLTVVGGEFGVLDAEREPFEYLVERGFARRRGREHGRSFYYATADGKKVAPLVATGNVRGL